jgi:hypothetical protein
VAGAQSHMELGSISIFCCMLWASLMSWASFLFNFNILLHVFCEFHSIVKLGGRWSETRSARSLLSHYAHSAVLASEKVTPPTVTTAIWVVKN